MNGLPAGGALAAKKNLPLPKVYALIEPGPVVLLATSAAGRPNVMPMSWLTMLEFEPPLIGCVVSDRNHSFRMLRASRECTINIPTVDIARQVVGCGNVSGASVDKFRRFKLTAVPSAVVGAPLVGECFANLECRVVDTGLLRAYSMFVLEVVQAWIDPRAKDPRTIHHRGFGRFMVAGETIKLRSRMP